MTMRRLFPYFLIAAGFLLPLAAAAQVFPAHATPRWRKNSPTRAST